jgi:hypothetical protein
MLPAVVQVPDDALYNSTLLRVTPLDPPVTNTFPVVKRVAVGLLRALLMLPVVVQVPDDVLYNSALPTKPLLYPPVTNTFPVVKGVAV